MDSKFWIEAVGYLGSALVVVSMLMSNVVRLRVINMIGSIIFAIYALIIRSYPTALMNAFLVGINVYHLLKLRNTQKSYALAELNFDDGFLRHFLSSHEEDIRYWFPGFSLTGKAQGVAYLVLCGEDPAGLFLAKKTEPGALDILLDYTTPAYRDASAGRYLYGELAKKGCRKLSFRQEAPRHTAYMEKVGFVKTGENAWEKQLAR